MLTWCDVIQSEQKQPYYQEIERILREKREAGKIIYPATEHIFNAFKLTPLDEVKVVILGQDPYHGAGQAHGLSFSVLPGTPIPPSLANIYKALQQDIANFTVPTHGFLESWAKQGVLLLNSVLTVEAREADSHKELGWEIFTDKCIELINQHCQGVVFLLWGKKAQKKAQLIDQTRHCILNAPHPSPLSAYRGFIGCRHFSQTNQWLEQQGKTAINWSDLSACAT